jgi:hypothetical protein
MPKKIFTQELEGTRRRGRPRKGWKEEVERDLQVLGVRRWRELVIDRRKWKDIVRLATESSSGPYLKIQILDPFFFKFFTAVWI